jgi:GH24 family phage-related lysozyme (muramidase)
MALKTSAAQIAKIKNEEVFASKAYSDGAPGGVASWSTGYGHKIGLNEQHLMTDTITKTQATVMLTADVYPLEIQINRDVRAKLTQNAFDSFVDFGFNEGSGALSKIIQTYNKSPLDTTALFAEMSSYNKWHDKNGNLVVNPTLTKRRAEEISNFGSILPAVPPVVKNIALAGAGLIVASVLFANFRS